MKDLDVRAFSAMHIIAGRKDPLNNRNKILRQFFPKGTNFGLISDDEIHRIQEMINNRPMKLLNWRSPADVFSSLRSGC